VTVWRAELFNLNLVSLSLTLSLPHYIIRVNNIPNIKEEAKLMVTDETLAGIRTVAAEDIAGELGLRRQKKFDYLGLSNNILFLYVTTEGIINLGRLKNEWGETATYEYENFTLNDVLLLEKRYARTEYGSVNTPTEVIYHLPESTIIYTGTPGW
jgi:hypothetical protein